MENPATKINARNLINVFMASAFRGEVYTIEFRACMLARYHSTSTPRCGNIIIWELEQHAGGGLSIYG
jgi:hypothetical protein